MGAKVRDYPQPLQKIDRRCPVAEGCCKHVDELQEDKERLKAENAHLRENLQAELQTLCEENERLKQEAEARRNAPALEDERDPVLEEQ